LAQTFVPATPHPGFIFDMHFAQVILVQDG